jgi:hypothetical protein
MLSANDASMSGCGPFYRLRPESGLMGYRRWRMLWSGVVGKVDDGPRISILP